MSTRSAKYEKARRICSAASASSADHTFVATIAWSRLPSSALPRTTSALPYIGDVSNRFAPRSRAVSAIRRRCSISSGLTTSNVFHVPMPTVGRRRPEVPSGRYSIYSLSLAVAAAVTLTAHHASRSSIGVLAGLQHLDAVDEDISHSGGILVRRIKRRVILNSVGIEHHHIRVVALPQPAAPLQPEVVSRKRGQPPHRLRDRNHAFVASVLRHPTRKRAVRPRMRARLQEDSLSRQRTGIRAKRHPRQRDRFAHVFFGHREKHALHAAVIFDHQVHNGVFD